jgi:hypothetical protein
LIEATIAQEQLDLFQSVQAYVEMLLGYLQKFATMEISLAVQWVVRLILVLLAWEH